MEETHVASGSAEVYSVRRPGTTLFVLAAYAATAVGLWWHVWSDGPRRLVTCPCSDAARFIWFFKWPEFAVFHGLNPFFSTYLFHPTGINLFNDSSVLGLSLPSIPITALFGPVFSVNVVSTLAPALAAFTMFLLVRRWVEWMPAAVLAGFIFGFSPAMLVGLAFTQLNLVFLAVLPLIVMALDELFRLQRMPAQRLGVCLAILIVVQFFISPEILLMAAMMSVGAIVPIWAWAGSRRGASEFSNRYVLWTLAVGGGLSVVLLAVPIGYFFFGPGHLVGPIWGSSSSLSSFGTTLATFFDPGISKASQAAIDVEAFWGHFGPQLPNANYLGLGFVALVVLSLILRRRDRILQLFAVVSVVAMALSLRPGSLPWVPWDVFKSLTLFTNMVEVRFELVVFFGLAVMVARTLDGLHGWLSCRSRRPGREWSTAITLAVALVCALPTALVIAPNFPLTVIGLDTPKWFDVVGRHLPPRQVLLTFPFVSTGRQGSEVWQATTGMPWMQVGGGGPASIVERAGPAEPGYRVLADITGSMAAPERLTVDRVRAVRTALRYWGVTMVVVPVQEALMPANRGRSTVLTVGFVSAILGERPEVSNGSFVWPMASGPRPWAGARGVDLARYADCTADLTVSRPRDMASCVLGSG